MAQGKVTVNNLNLTQGAFPEIERKALFIGLGTKNASQLLAINSQSDLDDLLGVNDSEIKRQVTAARVNGGENWHGYAMPQNAGYEWQTEANRAFETISVEFIVLCTPLPDAEFIDIMQAYAELLRTSLGRRVIILTATAGMTAGQEWSDYTAQQIEVVDSKVANRVACVPLLHGNDLGVLVGRLCNRAVSIADSPMRTATGALIGLGSTPADSEGQLLTNAVLAELDTGRLSCPQIYADYPGVYWGDCNLLDVPAGDYQVIEHLRPVDKAARAIRLLSIARIANRSLNQTPLSIAANKTYFSRPLREMSKSTVFNGEVFPGDIQPPKDDAVELLWPTNSQVEIYIKVQPYNSPKEIEANIILDLSSE